MAVNKFNKILQSGQGSGANGVTSDSTGSSASTVPSEVENAAIRAFLDDITDDEMADLIKLGAGPHSKNRCPIKISSVIPSRATAGSADVFFDRTVNVTYDSTLNSPNVYIKAEPTEFVFPATSLMMTRDIRYTITKSGGAPSVTTYTFVAPIPEINLTSIFTAGGSGDYSVRIELIGNAFVAALTSPIYLIGLSSTSGVWAGTPTVAPDGSITYDMTIEFPDQNWSEDWEVEISEI